MKVIKRLASLICGALLIFAVCALVGCKKQSDSDYVEGSFEYELQTYSGLIPDRINGSFKVNVSKNYEYSVSYEIEVEITNELTNTTSTKVISGSKTIAEGNDGQYTVSFSHSISKTSSSDKATSAIIKSVKLNGTQTNEETTENKSSKIDKNTACAIGFGVAAGAVLIGLTVVFILDKTGVLYKRK